MSEVETSNVAVVPSLNLIKTPPSTTRPPSKQRDLTSILLAKPRGERPFGSGHTPAEMRSRIVYVIRLSSISGTELAEHYVIVLKYNLLEKKKSLQQNAYTNF